VIIISLTNNENKKNGFTKIYIQYLKNNNNSYIYIYISFLKSY
jgi:hypothetical protein